MVSRGSPAVRPRRWRDKVWPQFCQPPLSTNPVMVQEEEAGSALLNQSLQKQQVRCRRLGVPGA